MSGRLMVYAVFVYISFTFLYTVLWFTLTPVMMMIFNALGGIPRVGWTSQASSTFSLVMSILFNAWTWIGMLSIISTIIWLYLFPYREEVDTFAIA
jgi:hypothetical protein